MYHFVYLGIPSEIFDEIERNKVTISGGKGAHTYFIKRDKNDADYKYRDLSAVLRLVSNQIASENDGDVGKTKFAVFYITHEQSDRVIREGLFPFIYTVPVDWTMGLENGRALKESKNELVKMLTSLGLRARHVLDVLERELKESMQKTPWLLPVRNFRSGYLVPHMLNLQRSLIDIEDQAQGLKMMAKFENRFRNEHPPQSSETGKYSGRKFFVDDTKLQFVPPGADLHGFSRTVVGHNLACVIGGRRRLGAPYDPGFHYDCTFSGGATQANLCNCHRKERLNVVSKKNINIATNDYIRPDAQ